MHTLGKGQVLQHPSSGHPSLPDPPEGAACRAGTVLLTHRTLGFFPFPLPGSCRCLPVPGSCRGPQCGRAAMAAVPPLCRETPRSGSSAIIKQLPGAGERGRCRPCPAAPALSAGRAETKAPVRCHSRSPRSATAAAGRAAPSCSTRPKNSLWCPRCGGQQLQGNSHILLPPSPSCCSVTSSKPEGKNMAGLRSAHSCWAGLTHGSSQACSQLSEHRQGFSSTVSSGACRGDIALPRCSSRGKINIFHPISLFYRLYAPKESRG